MSYILPRFDAVTVRIEGTRVLVIRDGQVVLNLPWGAALELSRVLYGKARQAEEVAQAERIIADHALLTRVGFPIGLSDNPAIRKEAWKEGQWNSALRRYIPHGVGIPSGEAVGAPTLISHPPMKEQTDAE